MSDERIFIKFLDCKDFEFGKKLTEQFIVQKP